MNLKKIKFRKAKLVPKSSNLESKELIFQICNFCGKQIPLHPDILTINKKLSGRNSLFCSFCLRNQFYTANNKNIFILSFKGIFGYLYFDSYIKNQKVWVSEITDYIFIHEQVGLKNPLFFYDVETMYWFIDFAKVGLTKRKLNVNEVLKVIINILTCFNLAENVRGLSLHDFFSEFKNPILDFYRKRKKEQRVLMPTFINCIPYTNFEFEKIKNFDQNLLKKG